MAERNWICDFVSLCSHCCHYCDVGMTGESSKKMWAMIMFSFYFPGRHTHLVAEIFSVVAFFPSSGSIFQLYFPVE